MRTSVFLLILLFVYSCQGEQKVKNSSQTGQHLKEGTRQIHLDFHTSEAIDNIGEKFEKEQFQEALIKGRVNSINIFAKGHHSWSYYPTKTGKMHPGLDFDLMGAQIEACREIGVTVQLYFTVGWSANDAIEHPEWAVLRKDGSNDYRDQLKNLGPDDHFRGWEYLEPSGEYAELILAQTEEILQNYEVDGIWYDIFQPYHVNYNEFARQDMREHGININDPVAVMERQVERYHDFMRKSHDLVKKYIPDASVYYNGTTATYTGKHMEMFKYKLYQYNTKHDLEDLPTAWGGYDIFPYRSKYFANTGKEIVAMSGKFHKSWGEFGGFKYRDAILYEAASMIAFGACVNFGDQLHPSGMMDMTTYENIGYAYDYVEKIEAYGAGAQHISSTGLYVAEDLPAVEGMVQMLLEKQVNFNVVNTLDDWSGIDILIITSGGVLTDDVPRIRSFEERGGKILAMGNGIFVDGQPIIDIGAGYLGTGEYDVDYTIVKESFSKEFITSPFLNYNAALRIEPGPDTEILAAIREPYFSRTVSHYCSHANTPFKLTDADHPAVIKKGNIIYLAHDLDRQYHREGARLHRELFYKALSVLRNKPLVTVEMPSMGRINLLHQPEFNRYVVHLLYASPIQRGSVRVIEDLVSLYNIPVTVDIEEEIKSAYLIPSGKKVKIRRNNGKILLTIPEMKCHTGLVLEY